MLGSWTVQLKSGRQPVGPLHESAIVPTLDEPVVIPGRVVAPELHLQAGQTVAP